MYVQDHQSLVSYRDNLAAHSMLCTDFRPIRSFVWAPLNLPLTCFIHRAIHWSIFGAGRNLATYATHPIASRKILVAR